MACMGWVFTCKWRIYTKRHRLHSYARSGKSSVVVLYHFCSMHKADGSPFHIRGVYVFRWFLCPSTDFAIPNMLLFKFILRHFTFFLYELYIDIKRQVRRDEWAPWASEANKVWNFRSSTRKIDRACVYMCIRGNPRRPNEHKHGVEFRKLKTRSLCQRSIPLSTYKTE